MTLREANDILQNPNSHWSHEIDDAKKYCIDAVKYLVNAADYRFMDEAQIAIKYIDERIAVVPANEGAMCGNCCWFDPVGHCQDELDPKTKFVSPIDDASSCLHYRPYPKEAIK